MGLILVVLAVAVVFVIAAVVVGREARRLAGKAPGRVFDFEEAVSWVCDHVNDEVAAVLTPDDVRQILGWHLEFFRLRGVSSNGDSPHGSGEPVAIGGAETFQFVALRAEQAEASYTTEQLNAVLDAQIAYLIEIGGIEEVAEPDDGV